MRISNTNTEIVISGAEDIMWVTVGANKKAIQEYIRNQLQEDYTEDQISIKEYVDPFTGEPVQGGK